MPGRRDTGGLTGGGDGDAGGLTGGGERRQVETPGPRTALAGREWPRGETAHWAPVLNEEPSRDPETPPRHLPRVGKTRSRRDAAPGCRSAPFAARSGEARRAPRAPRPRRPCPGPPLTGLGSRVRLPPSAPRGSPATSPRPRRHARHVWPGSWPSTAWRRPVTRRLQRDGPQVGLARTPRPPRFLPTDPRGPPPPAARASETPG